MKKRNINLEIAGIFFEMADILEMKKIQWKPQAYRMAAQTIESLRYNLTEIYKKEGSKGIDNLPGIGEGITKKIVEYIKTGNISKHEALKKSLPGNIYEVMKVPGIGPKKAMLFYEKLGIKNLKQLEDAAKEGKLTSLPGFKTRSQQKVLEGIGIKQEQKGRMIYSEAKRIAENISRNLKRLPEVQKVLVVGSLRRKKPTVGDIDIVVQTLKPEVVVNKYVRMPFVKKVLAKGKKKAIIITKEGIQADIRLVKSKEFGACVVYFTGDKQHNIWQRKVAIKKGWKLNEYGIFDKKIGKQIDNGTEKDIYNKLNIKMLDPSERVGETK